MSIIESFKAVGNAAGASFKSFLSGRTPAAQAAELAKEIAAAESELARLDGEYQRFLLPSLKGDPDAAGMVDQIKRDRDAQQGRLADLRQAKGQVDAQVRAATEAQRREEAAARPGHMAASRGRIFDLAQAIDRAGDALAAAIKAEITEIGALAAVADSSELHRWRGVAASQIRNGLVERFDINPSGPSRAENNLLGLVSTWSGEKAHWRVRDHMNEILDNTVPYFAELDEAEACRERLARRGTKAFVLELDGGTFAVIASDTIYATRAAAEAALATGSIYRTMKAVVVPWRDGFLIVPAGIADAVPK
jgi:hypothetical protein